MHCILLVAVSIYVLHSLGFLLQVDYLFAVIKTDDYFVFIILPSGLHEAKLCCVCVRIFHKTYISFERMHCKSALLVFF